MQKPYRNATYGNNAMVQEVKTSRIEPVHEPKQNVTHLHPQHIHSIDDEIHNDELEIRKTSHNKKNILNFDKLLDINKIFEFTKSDEFIILAVIAIVVLEGSGDLILLLALGYLLISDKF